MEPQHYCYWMSRLRLNQQTMLWLRPTTTLQYQCESIPYQKLFQEGQYFLEKWLSHAHLSIESLNDIIEEMIYKNLNINIFLCVIVLFDNDI
ncbi:hypothetical protein CR513_60035, partial [Mucuna pruriens]